MTDTKRGYAPAFPNEGGDFSGLHAAPGMSIRDYFTSRAAQALIESDPPEPGTDLARYADEVANGAVVVADALIRKLVGADPIRDAAVDLKVCLKWALEALEASDLSSWPSSNGWDADAYQEGLREARLAIKKAEAAGVSL